MIFKNKLKTAIITGSTRGVGKELAKMFLRNNYNVIVTGRNINNAIKVADELNSNKYTVAYARGYYLNYNNINKSSKLLNSLEHKEIIPNFLINNAGALNTKNLNDVSLKTIDIMTHANMIGPLIMSKYCIDIIKNNNEYGGILFNTPPYNIDDKTSYLLPYMQTKLAQTTLMKSLANLNLNNNALICGFWTNFPLSTDAIINKNIGTLDNCMHPSILSDTIEELIFNTINPHQYNSKVIIDEDFLNEKNISLNRYKMGKNVKKLDDLFMSYLKDKYSLKKNMYIKK
jgi:short-subunit dehydrogenase